MASSRGSDGVVVKTDLSEDSTNEHERIRAGGGGGGGGKAGSGAVAVPVSLPVGTLLAGTTFNVITSDQLHSFKPMLCVDNGFISSPVEEGELKAGHGGAAQRSPAESCEPGAASAEPPPSWEETAAMPVLHIRCKNTSAELHKSRFGSGGRGRCIKLDHLWYTPSEFEAHCGRASSKDWKRSIRFGGRSIQTLISEGILTPHATSCTCAVCCDDQSAMGPVRLFTPYKRRRRTTVETDSGKKILCNNRGTSEMSDSEMEQLNSSVHSREAWQTLAEGLDSNAEYHLLGTPDAAAPTPPDMDNTPMNRLENIRSSVMKLLNTVVKEIDQCREEFRTREVHYIEKIHQLEQERASAALLAASVEAPVVVSDQVALRTMEETDSKKCANCNRDASAECSLCRRTPYCSTFCQKKDWACHQIECLRSVPTLDQNPHQSIMLIVESQHQ